MPCLYESKPVHMTKCERVFCTKNPDDRSTQNFTLTLKYSKIVPENKTKGGIPNGI